MTVLITALAALAVLAPLSPTVAPTDLTPLCIVALGTAEPTDVSSCVLRLESLRVILPPVGTSS